MESEWKLRWESMTVDELFALREQMQEILSAKLQAKKADIDRRLKIINRQSRSLAEAKPYLP